MHPVITEMSHSLPLMMQQGAAGIHSYSIDSNNRVPALPLPGAERVPLNTIVISRALGQGLSHSFAMPLQIGASQPINGAKIIKFSASKESVSLRFSQKNVIKIMIKNLDGVLI